MGEQFKYDAFISYSHRDCGRIAPVIQKAIENIGKPWYKLKRNLNIFRDETNLAATPELWNTIVKAIDQSKHFILLASPETANSPWIRQELAQWLSKHYSEDKGVENLFIVLTQGELLWSESEADFDWSKTNALPKDILVNKNQREPLWIDLREYVLNDEKNTTVNYKAPGFTSAVAKIIGAILGKEPREIESEELNRRRNTITFLVVLSMILSTLIISSFFLYNQSKLQKKISASTALTAQGNKLSQVNISKALRYYYYAYLNFPDKANFQILNDFYESNLYFDEYKDYDSSRKLDIIRHGDTISTYFSRIKGFKNWGSSAINLNHQVYTRWYNDTLEIGSFNNEQKKYIVSEHLKECSYVSTPYCDTLFFIKHDSAEISSLTQIWMYNIKTQREDTLPINFRAISMDIGNAYPVAQLSENAKYLVLYQQRPEEFEKKSITLRFHVIDMDHATLKTHYLQLKSEEINPEVKSCKISADGKKLYIRYGSTAEGADYQNNNYIFDLEKDKLIKRFTEGANFMATSLIEPMSFEWGDNYFLYGNKGGQLKLCVGKDFSSEMVSFPNGSPPNEEISEINITDKYIITGTINGVVTIWSNPDGQTNGYTEVPIFTYLEQLISIKIPMTDSTGNGADFKGIYKLYYDEPGQTIYILNYNDDLFRISIKNYEALSEDVDRLKRQIEKLGLNDLSPGEKAANKIK